MRLWFIFVHEQRLFTLDHLAKCCAQIQRIRIFVFQELIDDLMERLQIFFRFQRFTDLLFETFQTVFVNVFCSWHLHWFDRLTGSLLDDTQHTTFTRRYEQDRVTSTTSTASTSDTVNIRFGIVRNVVVHNVSDTLNVQTTRNHVSRNQNIQLTGFQFLNGTLTQFLRNIAVQRFTRMTTRRQFACQLFCCGFRTYEDQQCIVWLNFQHTSHRVQFM